MVGGVIGTLVLLVVGQFVAVQNHRAVSERWEWACQGVAVTLQRAFSNSQPLLAVDPAGCAPYFSELPSLDMLGLNDRYLATHKPPGFGSGEIGHELGSGPYVLRRHPDLILMCSPYGSRYGCFRSGTELVAMPAFHARYRLIRFRGAYPNRVYSLVWVRTASAKIGVRTKDGVITIPGYLSATDTTFAVAQMNSHRALVASIPAHSVVLLPTVEVPPGRWRLGVSATRHPAITLIENGRSVGVAVTGSRLVLTVRSRVEFVISTSTTSATLAQVTLSKL